MNPANYKSERKMRGTQESVADSLGVGRVTIARRETGKTMITTEAWYALLSLPKTLQPMKTEAGMARALRIEWDERIIRNAYKSAKQKAR